METPNDNSPWRCPECGMLMYNCVCDEDRGFGPEENEPFYPNEFDGDSD